MACDLITTELAACESGIGKIDSQTRLLQLIAQLSCEIADAGGGGGGGTPGGAPGDVQFNNAGAFGGFGDFNSGTSVLTIPGDLLFATDNADDIGAVGANRPRTGYFGTSVAIGPASAAGSMLIAAAANVLQLRDGTNGAYNYLHAFGYAGISSANYLTTIDFLINGIQMLGISRLAWSASAVDSQNMADVGFARGGVGIVQVTDGTFGGPFRDLHARILRVAAFTVATLPAAGTAGRIAYVTDSLAPAFLAIAVGGGAIVTTVLDNGANWVTV